MGAWSRNKKRLTVTNSSELWSRREKGRQDLNARELVMLEKKLRHEMLMFSVGKPAEKG